MKVIVQENIAFDLHTICAERSAVRLVKPPAAAFQIAANFRAEQSHLAGRVKVIVQENTAFDRHTICAERIAVRPVKPPAAAIQTAANFRAQ